MLELMQPVAYPNELLPYALKHVSVTQAQPDFGYHFHPDCEFIFVESGSGRFHIDNLKFDSQAGDIIMISPNVMHSIHPIDGESHRFKLLNVHLDLIGLALDDYTAIRYLKPLQNGISSFTPRIAATEKAYPIIKKLLLDICLCADTTPPFHSFLIKAKTAELFYQLYRNGYINAKRAQTTAYRREERIRKTIDFINANYMQAISVQDMAKVSGYSLSHFMLFFKEFVGTSANDYLVQVRLRRAAELVKESTLAITEIASQVGFNNLSNFNRQFKSHFDTTPMTMRKTHRSREKQAF